MKLSTINGFRAISNPFVGISALNHLFRSKKDIVFEWAGCCGQWQQTLINQQQGSATSGPGVKPSPAHIAGDTDAMSSLLLNSQAFRLKVHCVYFLTFFLRNMKKFSTSVRRKHKTTQKRQKCNNIFLLAPITSAMLCIICISHQN